MRKKAIWIGGISILALLTGATFLGTRRQPDPLAPLSKYIVSDETIYIDAETARLDYNLPTIPGVSQRTVDLKGVSIKELETVLKRLAMPREDWYVQTSSSTPFFFGAWRKPDFFEDISAAMLDARLEGGSFVPVTDIYSVTLRKPLSKWDIVLIWLKHAGRSPYAEPPVVTSENSLVEP